MKGLVLTLVIILALAVQVSAGDVLVVSDLFSPGRILAPPLDCMVYRGNTGKILYIDLLADPDYCLGTSIPGGITFRANAEGDFVFNWKGHTYVLVPAGQGRNSVLLYERGGFIHPWPW